MKVRLVPAVLLAVTLGAVLAAPVQAQSNLRVTAIRVTPEPFRAGANVAITVVVKNTGAGVTNPGTAYLDIFKSDSWLAAERVFHAEQAFPGIAAGAAQSVAFGGRWPVAAGSERYYVRVTALDPPNEFGEARSAVFVSTCQYLRQADLIRLPNMRLRDVKPQ